MLCRASCGLETHTGAGPFKITSLGGDSAEKLQKTSARGVVTIRFREVTDDVHQSNSNPTEARDALGVEISNLSPRGYFSNP